MKKNHIFQKENIFLFWRAFCNGGLTMYLYIWKTMQGYRIKTYINSLGKSIHYIGYSKKQAIKKHRETYGLKYKRLEIVDFGGC